MPYQIMQKSFQKKNKISIMQLLRYRSSHNQDFGSEHQKSLGTK